jgi:Uma2 family endonuclease
VGEERIHIPAAAHTLAGFRAWAKSPECPEKARVSFIDQEIFIDMRPEELESHVYVKVKVDFGVVSVNKKKKLGRFYGDGCLVTNVEAELSTVPDSVFLLWESLKAGRSRLIPREGEAGEYMEIEGTPDWILEVVSNYTLLKDTRILRQKYHRAGIPEFWLVNTRGREIDFQILLCQADDYVISAPRGDWQKSSVFRQKFRLVRERGPLGFWEYTLQSKALR